MSKHTAGPWTEDMIGAVYRRTSGGYYNQLMVEIRGGDTLNNHESAANARLIAAAPELLELAQMALKWIDAVPADTVLPAMPGFDRDWAEDVIAKGQG